MVGKLSPINMLSHDDIIRAQMALQDAWDENQELPPIDLSDDERFHLVWPVLKAAFSRWDDLEQEDLPTTQDTHNDR